MTDIFAVRRAHTAYAVYFRGAQTALDYVRRIEGRPYITVEEAKDLGWTLSACTVEEARAAGFVNLADIGSGARKATAG